VLPVADDAVGVASRTESARSESAFRAPLLVTGVVGPKIIGATMRTNAIRMTASTTRRGSMRSKRWS
jgi:hypothetical protein